jgi:hypothetical protein
MMQQKVKKPYFSSLIICGTESIFLVQPIQGCPDSALLILAFSSGEGTRRLFNFSVSGSFTQKITLKSL